MCRMREGRDNPVSVQQYQWTIYFFQHDQLDVVTAFLNGWLDKDEDV
jgi:hypothetical protein